MRGLSISRYIMYYLSRTVYQRARLGFLNFQVYFMLMEDSRRIWSIQMDYFVIIHYIRGVLHICFVLYPCRDATTTTIVY